MPHLDERILAALRRITRAIDLHSSELQQQYGLTVPQLLTLRELQRTQPLAVGALAAAVNVSQATMTGILDRLQRRELVARARAGQDRRSFMVTLTEVGTKLANSSPSLLHDRFRQELEKLEIWEQTAMLAMLQRIATMMGAQELTAAPILTSGSDALTDATAAGAAKTK